MYGQKNGGGAENNQKFQTQPSSSAESSGSQPLVEKSVSCSLNKHKTSPILLTSPPFFRNARASMLFLAEPASGGPLPHTHTHDKPARTKWRKPKQAGLRQQPANSQETTATNRQQRRKESTHRSQEMLGTGFTGC